MSAEQLTVAQPGGMEPAGMLRIRRDGEERFVWPVHLPGWLALGWRVAGTGENPAPAARTSLQAEAPKPSPSAPQTGKGQRNRRRKEANDADAAEPPIEAPEPEPCLDALPVDLLDDPLS